MTSDNIKSDSAQPERRQREDLRKIFDEVLTLVRPFVQTPGASLDYWAYRAVRNAYPDLDEQGLRIVLHAAIRVSAASVSGSTPETR